MKAVVWEGTFKIFGVELKCYVLGDGTRIIDSESMDALFAAMQTATPETPPGDFEAFSHWRVGKDIPTPQ